MRLETSIKLISGVYHVTVDLASEDGFTPVEQEAITQQGEPTIDVGGSFDDQAGLTYTLDTKQVQFPSQFPQKKTFSKTDYPSDAADRAQLWLDTVKTRIDTGVTAQRTATASNIAEEIVNIDTSD